MSLTVDTIIESARYEHPAWHSLTQPHGPVLRRMNIVQRELFNDALHYDPKFMAQRLGILVKGADFTDFAGKISAGAVAVEPEPTGPLAELVRSSTVDDEGEPTSATTTTLADTSKSWGIDAYAGKYAYIDHGVGEGQIRKIASNTATVLTIESADPWTTVPTTASHYQILAATITDEDDLFITKGVRPQGEQTGYAVKYDYSTGTAYIATDEPLVVRFHKGITLPAMRAPVGMTIYRANNTEIEGTIVNYNLRYQPPRRPAAYLLNNVLYLIDPGADWRTDDQIEFHYIPIPPRLTKTTDILLLPDAAEPYLHWEACCVLEQYRKTGEDWESKATSARQSFLTSQGGQIGVSRVKEVF